MLSLKQRWVGIGVALIGLAAPMSSRSSEFDALSEGQRIADFELECVYENETDQAIGARFRHAPSRFVLDVLRIQSLPQAFTWVNSPPPSDKGEPHTLEHLLLGKGTKGRYVASLEEMMLGSSSAYTEQRRTCYHFNSAAGTDAFFELFEEKLAAMLHPTFSDEEIRREVCNMGVIESQEDGSLWLEEKGTVYNEMVSTYERPWGNLYRETSVALYGEGHPNCLDSGGTPAGIRALTPEEIRKFHADTHHLNNMGSVISIGEELSLEICLTEMSELLARVEPDAKAKNDPADFFARLPIPRPAIKGTFIHASFPHHNENEPGLLALAWPAERALNTREMMLITLFLDALAQGQTSNLYGMFINSQTQQLDIGATAVFNWWESEPGYPVFVGFANVEPNKLDDATMTQVRDMVLAEIERITELSNDSKELAEFNSRVRNLLIQERRSTRDFLNSPPRWGFRGTGSAWIDQMQILHRKGGFRRDLAFVEELAFVESLLDQGGNFWRSYVEAWKLLELPYVASTRPDPDMLSATETAREARIRTFVDDLKQTHEASNDADAIAAYQAEYAKGTAIIDETAGTIEMPEFVENPPLSLDENLKYSVRPLPGGGDFVVSTFENMTSATAGVALRMDTIPEEYLAYVPALTTVLEEIGVTEDGTPISFEDFTEIRRREILALDVYVSSSHSTERVELVIRGKGSELSESLRAIHWMETALLHPDLRVENLPRIRDAVDQALAGTRNRMRGSEESWVNEPADAYWKQGNPLLLAAESFLTQGHSLQRLRWMLKEADAKTATGAAEFIHRLLESGATEDREMLVRCLGALSSDESGVEAGSAADGENANELSEATENLVAEYRSLDPEVQKLVDEATEDVRRTVTDIPDGSLEEDVSYVCNQMLADLAVAPSEALSKLDTTLGFIRKQRNARAFAIGSSVDLASISPRLEAMITSLDEGKAQYVSYSDQRLVDTRLATRTGEDRRPVYVALVNESTRSGVHIHTANCASYSETDPDQLLRFLSARIYGGGGAHSMFMKTWAAGLAYSNGLRSNEYSGRLVYYAERCPDLTQTLQFVIDQIESAPHDSALANYAVAQAFSNQRSGARYEQRGESMSIDLANGLTPEAVARFRRAILELKENPDLYEIIHAKMVETYGLVLPGLGPSGAEAQVDADANYFVIGPAAQLKTWESYLTGQEPGASLSRIYPRDFWQVGDAGLVVGD